MTISVAVMHKTTELKNNDIEQSLLDEDRSMSNQGSSDKNRPTEGTIIRSSSFLGKSIESE
jgi:hypothetical protein